jgi:hypothetical protein
MNCYNISLHDFLSFFLWIFFFKMIFVNFNFFILSWLRILFRSLKKKHCGLLQCFPTWFLFYYSVSPHVFFFKIIFVEFFFNIVLIENLALTFHASTWNMLFRKLGNYYYFLIFLKKYIKIIFYFFKKLFLILICKNNLKQKQLI